MGRKRRAKQAEAEWQRTLEWRLERVAHEIYVQVATAGLPVVPVAGAGVMVEIVHNPGTDPDVWVGWMAAPSLREAVDGADAHAEAVVWLRSHAYTILTVMTEAIRAILTSSGFSVAVQVDGGSSYTVRVLDIPRALHTEFGLSS
ncbi:hypothetical protein [Streptomyces sp. NPDC046909]|uniref:hypothetical protein n=1 Tax=Streptomyces sp. NPDC046909 TaxID=3155617 RepID=UPI0033C821BB